MKIITKTLTCIAVVEIFLSLKIIIDTIVYGTTGEATLHSVIKIQSVLTK